MNKLYFIDRQAQFKWPKFCYLILEMELLKQFKSVELSLFSLYIWQKE